MSQREAEQEYMLKMVDCIESECKTLRKYIKNLDTKEYAYVRECAFDTTTRLRYFINECRRLVFYTKDLA